MKLWEIKAQALRLMFSSSDMEYSEEEFTNQDITLDSNTQTYLVRMKDSIMRAIDLYYFYCGEISQRTELGLFFTYSTPGDDTTPKVISNYIDVSGVTNFSLPTRVDLMMDSENRILGKENIDYTWDPISKRIYLEDVYNEHDLSEYLKFKVHYKMYQLNISLGETSENEYDLNTIYIPEPVQRKIPLFIKGELYEEDEPMMAREAKDEYIAFLIGFKKNFSKVSKKVVSPFRRFTWPK